MGWGAGKAADERSAIATYSISILAKHLVVFVATAALVGVALFGTLLILPDYSAGDVPLVTVAVLLIAAMTTLLLRVLIARRRSASTTGNPLASFTEVQANQASATPATVSGGSLTTTCAADVAEAVVSARVSRIVMLGAEGALCDGGVTLARQLAGRAGSTILVDFMPGVSAARQMGLMADPAASAEIAASPTSFAHSIHRDRRSAAHTLAAIPGAKPSDRLLVGHRDDAAAMIVTTLGEAYAYTIVLVANPVSIDLSAIVTDDTAVVVPISSGHERSAGDAVERLFSLGFADVILMTRRDVAVEAMAA